MSKQLIVDYIPFQVSPQQINESLENNGGRLIVKGTLQRVRCSKIRMVEYIHVNLI
jgi:hypothetical protein